MTAQPAPAPIGVHVVVGAGEVGTAIATQLADAGREVVLVSRRGRGPQRPGIRLVAADVARPGALAAAAERAVVVYNAVNPEYHRWETDWPPMAAAFLDYAQSTGAVLATVSNLYGYGPVDEPMREDLPLAATGAKARVRVAMWREALAAHEAGRIRAVEVRGSDYVCAGSQSMLGDRVVPRVLAGKTVQLIGNIDAAHTWTDPRDTARTIITVAADPRGWGQAWHVPSDAPRSQRQAVTDIAATVGVAPVKVAVIPTALLRLVGVFNPVVRELKETDYQRNHDYVLDDSAVRREFGLDHTPWQDSLRELVRRYTAGVQPAA